MNKRLLKTNTDERNEIDMNKTSPNECCVLYRTKLKYNFTSFVFSSFPLAVVVDFVVRFQFIFTEYCSFDALQLYTYSHFAIYYGLDSLF